MPGRRQGLFGLSLPSSLGTQIPHLALFGGELVHNSPYFWGPYTLVLRPDHGPTASASTLPRPVAPEPLPVPADHGLWPHHLQRIPPALPEPRQDDPEDPVHRRQPGPRLACLSHGELLPKRKVLQRQLPVRANRGSQCPKEDPKPSDHDRPNSGSACKTQDNRDGRLFRKDTVQSDRAHGIKLIGILWPFDGLRRMTEHILARSPQPTARALVRPLQPIS
jgi:hypothetical protein